MAGNACLMGVQQHTHKRGPHPLHSLAQSFSLSLLFSISFTTICYRIPWVEWIYYIFLTSFPRASEFHRAPCDPSEWVVPVPEGSDKFCTASDILGSSFWARFTQGVLMVRYTLLRQQSGWLVIIQLGSYRWRNLFPELKHPSSEATLTFTPARRLMPSGKALPSGLESWFFGRQMLHIAWGVYLFYII